MDEELIKKIQPHSVEAEQSVIGSMLMDHDAVATASELLNGEDFYQFPFGVMFTAIVELYNEGRPVDPVTVQDKMREKDVPAELCSFEYIRDLIMSVPTSANIRSYAEIVREKAVLRRLIHINDEVSNACYLGREPLDEILEKTEKSVFDLIRNGTGSDHVPIDRITLDVLDRIEEAYRNKSTVTGLATGFTDLDYKTSGLQKSDLILVAARPSMGKTALVLNIAQYVAVRKKKHVALFSLEMSKEQLVNRLLAMESGIDSQKLRTGNLVDNDWDMLVESVSAIGDSGLIIDDTPGISVTELRSKCRKYSLECGGIDLIIIDYLQLMSSGKRGSDNRQQEISEISRSLKAIAREMNCPVISLSQLSRAVESRNDKRPMLSDLRESGAIEQDADVVMFIYRDDYYNKDSENKGIAEIIIAKQRNGPTGTVNLVWLPETTRFANAQQRGFDKVHD